jgi:hypothetical protein
MGIGEHVEIEIDFDTMTARILGSKETDERFAKWVEERNRKFEEAVEEG